ncbi:MAG TPA: hypothetical protein VEY89_11310 [Candidatus Dormibacteraeota bacterium]|nr:hypothetical protein [Candidatus Dormibacteraeota bacterium]
MHLARHRLVALVAACALAVSAAVYAAHGLADRDHAHTHCDLCVHLSGTAGTPALLAVLGKPLLVLTAVRVPPGVRLVASSPRGPHSARGPP